MNYEQTIEIPMDFLCDIEAHLKASQGWNDSDELLWVWTANFPDHMEIDIKVVDSYNANEWIGYCGPWCEAVLFEYGCEVACSEASETLAGEWTLTHQNNQYTVVVMGKEEE
jgi:hypothetical protein